MEIAHDVGIRDKQAVVLGELGTLYERLGAYDKARQRLEEAVAIGKEIGFQWLLAGTGAVLGDVAFHQKQIAEARQHYLAALQSAVSAQANVPAMHALTGLARILAAEDERIKAIELLAFVLQNLKGDQEKIEMANNVLAEIEVELPAEMVQAAKQRGQQKAMSEILAEIQDNGQ